MTVKKMLQRKEKKISKRINRLSLKKAALKKRFSTVDMNAVDTNPSDVVKGNVEINI